MVESSLEAQALFLFSRWLRQQDHNFNACLGYRGSKLKKKKVWEVEARMWLHSMVGQLSSMCEALGSTSSTTGKKGGKGT